MQSFVLHNAGFCNIRWSGIEFFCCVSLLVFRFLFSSLFAVHALFFVIAFIYSVSFSVVCFFIFQCPFRLVISYLDSIVINWVFKTIVKELMLNYVHLCCVDNMASLEVHNTATQRHQFQIFSINLFNLAIVSGKCNVIVSTADV